MLHNDPAKVVNLEETVIHSKILASLDLSGNDDAETYQQEIAGNLAHVFSTGGRGVKSDKWKAKAYARQFVALNKKLGNISLSQDMLNKARLEDTSMRTKTGFDAFNWFNDARLFVVRGVILAEALKGPLLGAGSRILGFIGFGYALRLVFDLGIVAKAIFKPDTDAEKALSYWERFKAVMKNNNRAYRMANDALWLAINVTALLCTGGLSVVGTVSLSIFVNIVGFVFDSIVECVKWSEVTSHRRAIKDAKDKVRSIEENSEWENIQNDLSVKKASIEALEDYYYKCTTNEEHKLVTDTIASLKNEIEDLNNHGLVRERNKWAHIADRLTAKAEEVRTNRLKEIALMFVICAGMVLAMTPFTMPIGLVILAASVSLVTGSLFTGFGARIASYFKNAVAEEKVDEAVKQPLLQPNVNRIMNRMRSSSVSEISTVKVVNENMIDVSVASPSKRGMFARRMSDPTGMPIKVNTQTLAMR